MPEQEHTPIKEAYIQEILAAHLGEPFTIVSIEEVNGDYIHHHQSDPQEIPEDTYDWIERVWLVRILRHTYRSSFYVAIPVDHPVVLKGSNQ